MLWLLIKEPYINRLNNMLQLINKQCALNWAPSLALVDEVRGKELTILEGHYANQIKGKEEHNNMHTIAIPL